MKKYRLIITGATGGIGKALLKQLAPHLEGSVICGLEENALVTIKTELNLKNCWIVSGRLENPITQKNIYKAAQNLKKPNLLINNAGANEFGYFHQMNDVGINQIIGSNLISPMQLTNKLIPLLNHDQESQIINTGSIFGYLGFPGFVAYSSAKFGLRGFSQALRRELGDTNIRVRYFTPRATKTNFNDSRINKMNEALNTTVDDPNVVALAFHNFIGQTKWQEVVGFTESIFVFINKILPNIVDKALIKKLPIIKKFLGKD